MTEPEAPPRQPGLGLPLGLAVVWTLAYAGWTTLVPPFGAALDGLIDRAAVLPFRLAIALLALGLARSPALEPRARLAFRLLGASFVISTAANLLRLGGFGGAALDPRLALTLALPQAGLMLAGLWQLASLRREPGRVADWLDAAAIVLGLFLLSSHFIAGGNPFDSAMFGARRWLFLLYLMADISAVFFVATAWFRRPHGISRDALGLFTIGFALIAIVDLVYDQQIQQGRTSSGGALGIGVAVSFLLIFAGLDLQRRFPPSVPEPARASRRGRDVVAPLAILLSTIPMLRLAWAGGEHGSHLAFHVTGMVMLLMLVLVRHHVAHEQTVQLARERATADARFRSLVQRSSDAILQVSTDHVIQWASPSAGDLAGTIPALLAGRRISELAHPDDVDRLSTFLANASQPYARNAAVRWRLGRPERWHEVESVVTDLTADPDVGSIVLNTRDVSERVMLEQQLRQSQKLEAVGRLAGGIAHDFNNILAAIISHANLVREGLPRGDARAEDLLEIEQTAQRGAVLTRRLLSFSRPEAGELHAHSLTAVLGAMEPMLRRLLVGRVELQLDLGDDELWVRTAEGQLEQILMNLAINARDALPEGGAVRILTRSRTIKPGESGATGLHPGRWVEIAVRDEGIGMTPDTLAHLFEPFFTTKPSGLGTGLGLTTVRSIVRSLGGHVLAESALGAGTTMRVLLPTASAAPAPLMPKTEASAPLPTDRRTVLIVDDELSLRTAMERLLRRSGYEVIGAGSAQEALALLDARDWRVDLVITDMVMPRMGGREFVLRLRSRRPDLPVICMSGHMEWGVDGADEEDAPWRPDRLLSKPFGFPEFLQRVRETLGPPASADAAAGAAP